MMTVALLLLLGVVEGRVEDERTGAGIGKAAVRLMIREDRAAGAVLTDRDGSFKLEAIRPGRYRVEVEHPAYSRKWRAALKSPRVVEISDGSHVKDLVYRLVPLGVLAGRVVDEDRGPHRGAAVMALKKYEEKGMVLWQQASTARTDDRGEYRLDGLEPGEYVLLTAAQREREPKQAALTFFPRGQRIEDAAVLKLEPGSIREGLEMTAQLEAVRRVGGRVDLDKGEAEVKLVVGGLGDAVGLAFSSQGTRKGEFEFKDLPGGEYLLVAGTEKAADKRYAVLPVKLIQEDREGLLLRLEPLPLLQGRVEGLKEGESARVVARGMGWREGSETKTGKNGEFALGLLPGPYILEVRGLKEGLYVEGGTLRKIEVPGDSQLVLTVKAGTGDVLCFAAPGEEIRFENDGEARTVMADENGLVTAKNLPPGKYQVIGEAGKPREVLVESKTIVGMEVAR
ncbi:MAG: carboxypeptidase regulatory-like domain-containing protein [Bryobacteraceae bacterium]|nr:carboxypeptidase regulatory-like domain-containing protein [Bryobacteraceae bacterium]